jgi:hypothetical protein
MFTNSGSGSAIRGPAACTVQNREQTVGVCNSSLYANMHLFERLTGFLHLLKVLPCHGLAEYVAASLIQANKLAFSSTYDRPEFLLDIPLLNIIL